MAFELGRPVLTDLMFGRRKALAFVAAGLASLPILRRVKPPLRPVSPALRVRLICFGPKNSMHVFAEGFSDASN